MSESRLYELTDLWKTYSNGAKVVEVLRGVNLSVNRGESVAITGPSGVGKSTLLHIMGLLDKPVSGKLLFNGMDTHELSESARARLRNRTIGIVFQFFQLLPEFTALENVIMPGRIAGERANGIRERAESLLEAVGLADRLGHRPGELSGGEQQRVAIARALVMNPDVILADEPTGNLDPDTGVEIEILLRDLNVSQKTTLIVVTHKESLSRVMDRRVSLMGGRLVELR